MQPKIVKSESEWKKALTPEQYAVARMKETERPFTGAYWNHHEPGIYQCVCCGLGLFDSSAKYDSGSGWPSFTAPLSGDRVLEAPNRSHGMERVEVLCAGCEAHLGHVFPDGIPPAGRRYCINSAALVFVRQE